MKLELPRAVKVCLWSYDTEALDLERHKQRIIVQVLNYGGMEATAWLRRTYSTEELAAAVSHSMRSEWWPKSLNYWSGVLNASPERASRFS